MVKIRGSVRTEHASQHPLVVVLVRIDDPPRIVDHYVLEKPGRFFFEVLPGAYALGAWEDLNANGIYEYEPAAPVTASPRYELSPGERLDGIEIVIRPEGRGTGKGPVNIAEIQARSAQEQEEVTVGQLMRLGEIVRLDDPRFSAENGNRGLWKRVDFMHEVGAGLYFLEECSTSKTPVLFVHGMKGYPREFEALVANLDRDRFQPWFFYYPSGGDLDLVSNALTQQMIQLRLRCRFDEVFVVAHSMGGLVARSSILEHYERTQREGVKLFVSISTPWRGMKQASSSEQAPERVRKVLPPAFKDVAWDSAFINGLFFEGTSAQEPRRTLPEHVAYYALFGHKRGESSFGPSSDGVVPTASAARLEVVEEARKVYPLDYDHTEILRSPEASTILNRILARAIR
jgi:pimeloyl-ACP methyl ester carboxylesterase